MKKYILSLVYIVCLLCYDNLNAQNYTWMKGSNSATVAGVYGTQGVAALANAPGARHGCNTWTDASGNMWLFGGEGVLNRNEWFSDLWKYSPVTNQWTWIKGPNTANNAGIYGTMGTAAMANNPGCREFAVSWTDASGNFWLYGGDGCATTFTGAPMSKLADLWMYNPTTNMWTWMKGPNTLDATGVYGTQNLQAPSNFPGGRFGSATWYETGFLWLFGGTGYATTNTLGRLNDLWKYSTSSNQWTWVSGANTTDNIAVYGTFSVSATSNMPSSRSFPGFFKSNTAGKLILFGGQGYSTVPGNPPPAGFLNDMWEFNIATGNWTWIGGSNMLNQVGIYGTAGVEATANVPGARFSPACWTDPMGNYWLFGGQGMPSNNANNNLSDLFRYNPTTNMWAAMKGPLLSAQTGTYGTMGVTAVSNNPGARYYNSWWRDASSGYLWLFGGLGYNSTAQNGQESMNDLWKFKLPCSADSVIALPSVICSGNSVVITAYNQFPSPVTWHTAATGANAISSGSVFSTSQLTALTTSLVYTFYAEANTCTLEPRSVVTITVLPLPQVTIAGPSSVCAGQSTVSLTSGGAQTYTWSNGTISNVLTPTLSSTGFTGSVTGTDFNNCSNTATISIGVFPLPTVTAFSSKPQICRGFDCPVLSAYGANTYQWSTGANTYSIAVSPTITTTYTVVGTDLNGCSNSKTIIQYVATCIPTGTTCLSVGINYLENNTGNFNLYPNPCSGSFNVSLTQNATLNICNALSQQVFEIDVEAGTSVIKTELSKGIYYYRLRLTNSKIANGKLIIE